MVTFHLWLGPLAWTQSWTNCRLCSTVSLMFIKPRKMQQTSPLIPAMQVRNLATTVLSTDHWMLISCYLLTHRLQNRKQHVDFFVSYSGALSAIRNAFDKSTDAAKKTNASMDTVKESSGVRDKTLDLQNQVQPANIRDLEKLNQSMASQPDLTPVAKQVQFWLLLWFYSCD